LYNYRSITLFSTNKYQPSPSSNDKGLSYDANVVHLPTWTRTLPKDQTVVVAIGALAHGADTFADAYVEEKISVSEYPLSASVACGKICCAFEDLWNIL
jgi:rRNA small subunit pseudouridine methyltransferase Nep1